MVRDEDVSPGICIAFHSTSTYEHGMTTLPIEHMDTETSSKIDVDSRRRENPSKGHTCIIRA